MRGLPIVRLAPVTTMSQTHDSSKRYAFMKTWTRSLAVVPHLLALCLVITPTALHAQSATSGAIAGTARDATGAVLPGVTVEASSPTLIEKVRSAVSDGNGEYKIVDLRPGEYTVTFSLEGFSTIKREGVELSAGFTAAVNAEMQVGGIGETLLVTGASPVVDVQNSRSQQVLTNDVLSRIPLGNKSSMSLAAVTLGAVSAANRNDVGGDKGESGAMVIHGLPGDDGRINYDGSSINYTNGGAGGTNRIYNINNMAVQEIVLDTGGASAEVETGGGNYNAVPKDGGNRFVFEGLANFTNSDLSSTAIPSELVARGLGPQPGVKKIWDYAFGAGGPIKRDKIWFYSANRWWGAQSFSPGNYYNATFGELFYTPDRSRPAYIDSTYADNTVRVTTQLSPKHKLAVTESINRTCHCAYLTPSFFRPEASPDYEEGPQSLTQVMWYATLSPKLLVHAGGSFLVQTINFDNEFTPGPGVISTVDLVDNYRYNGIATAPGGVPYAKDVRGDNYNQRVSLSYVTGSHAFKSGFQALQGIFDVGPGQPNENLSYVFRNRMPISLSQWAGPLVARSRIREYAVYAQDQWTLKRLTLNLGIRYDHHLNFSLPEDVPAGRFRPAFSVPGKEVPNFKDINPRIGVAFDVFGTGKTAIKGSFGRYLTGLGAGMITPILPSLAIVQSTNRGWGDANLNYVPDCDLNNLLGNGECTQVDNLRFGQPVAVTSLDDNAAEGWGKRGYNWQTTAVVQHELFGGVSASAAYYRSTLGNFVTLVNTALTPADYTPYCITAPTDVRLPGGGGNTICGLYDVVEGRFGNVNNVLKLVDDAVPGAEQVEIYNGFEFSLNAKLTGGAILNGGVSLGRTTYDDCWANDHPNMTPQSLAVAGLQGSAAQPRSPGFCDVEAPWWSGSGSQIKILGSVPLPWGLMVSGSYKNLPGVPINANLSLTSAQLAPFLGRPATAPLTTISILPYFSTAVPTGTSFEDRLNQTDLRVTKRLRFGTRSITGNVDLYNIFNARTIQTINPQYGPAYRVPTGILGGRLLKFEIQVVM